jgi:hypothetical protein
VDPTGAFDANATTDRARIGTGREPARGQLLIRPGSSSPDEPGAPTEQRTDVQPAGDQ